jgi:hypothetical protein
VTDAVCGFHSECDESKARQSKATDAGCYKFEVPVSPNEHEGKHQKDQAVHDVLSADEAGHVHMTEPDPKEVRVELGRDLHGHA